MHTYVGYERQLTLYRAHRQTRCQKKLKNQWGWSFFFVIKAFSKTCDNLDVADYIVPHMTGSINKRTILLFCHVHNYLWYKLFKQLRPYHICCSIIEDKKKKKNHTQCNVMIKY